MDYTKGPWTWDDEESAIVSGTPEKGKAICYLEKYSKKEFEGNKNLIQAAPDMHEALKAIVNWYEVKGEMLCTNDQPYELLKQALKKAEGRTD